MNCRKCGTYMGLLAKGDRSSGVEVVTGGVYVCLGGCKIKDGKDVAAKPGAVFLFGGDYFRANNNGTVAKITTAEAKQFFSQHIASGGRMPGCASGREVV